MDLREIAELLQEGKAKQVKQLIQQALEEGIPAQVLLDEALIAGMNEIGEKFKHNEIFVPQVLVAARAMNTGMEVLRPSLVAGGGCDKENSVCEGSNPSTAIINGRVCIGTVKGDLHDIGKNLVKMMLEAKGLRVFDLGTDVLPEEFIQTAIEKDCQVICCSALLTTTMSALADVVKEAEKAGIRDRVKIMVGGAPVTETFCAQIGADGFTYDAASAADMAVQFCKEKL